MREFAAVDLAGWNYNAAGVVISVTLGPGDQRPPERVLERGLMLDLAPQLFEPHTLTFERGFIPWMRLAPHDATKGMAQMAARRLANTPIFSLSTPKA
jgi:hypothetical protein